MLLQVGDHLGSTTAVVDHDTSELVERSTYEAYGNDETDYRPARWGNLRESFRFTGKEYDVEVGLHYFGARYYSPHLTRWISADPLTIHGHGADLNPYAYVAGKVLTAVDPYGFNSNDDGFPGTATPPGLGELTDIRYDFKSPRPSMSGYDKNGILQVWNLDPSKPLDYEYPVDPSMAEKPTIKNYVAGIFSKTLADICIPCRAADPNYQKYISSQKLEDYAKKDAYRDAYRKVNPVRTTMGVVFVPGEVGLAAEGVDEGIYEFTASSGKTYVGQSGDVTARLEQHLETGKLLETDLSTVETSEVQGGKLAREIAEQQRINALGGVHKLENVRNPIGPARQHLMPGED